MPIDLEKVRERHDDGHAFVADAADGTTSRAPDVLAQTLAEEYVAGASSGEHVAEDVRNAVQIEELGGPFVETDGDEELADTEDDTNPADGDREPFPTATRAPDEDDADDLTEEPTDEP